MEKEGNEGNALIIFVTFCLMNCPLILIMSNVFWKGKAVMRSASVIFPSSKEALIPPAFERASLSITVILLELTWCNLTFDFLIQLSFNSV